ncbi:myotubularin-related protein 14 [Anoplophora glabripennis]|nr:myotubularin-related protein 14 [Anoplophora glabripennis]
MSSAMCDNQNFDSSIMNLVTSFDIKNLLEYFAKNTYGAKAEDNEANSILERCTKLMEIDYSLLKVSNKNGELCPQYPSQLLILEYENGCNQNINTSNNCSQSTQRITDTIYESIDLQKIRDQFNRARYARCRLRFPVPTILYRGKYVCRSSTLSGGPEIYGRSGLDYLFYGSIDNSKSEDEMDCSEPDCSTPSDWQLFDKVRSQDIKLLKRLNIGTIVDLMVEKKKVKFGMYVTSSEKVDKENRYSDFNIISLPYPGCEFFKDFRDNNYTAEDLIFDWTQEQCDANISVPDNPLLRHLRIEWNNYKQWDLILMTQNYIKYLLKYLQDNTSGILVHCISGWDRTPLFISLLRLCLWADGLIHQGLDDHQILYLTIAYDWMLFGHRLSDRLVKGEEIFFFCFYMLKYLMSDEFSVAPGRYKHKKHTEKIEDVTIKSEYEPVGELLLEQDHLRGSNVSLNSICSTISNKSQDLITWYHNSDESNGNLANSAMSLDVRDTLPLGASASPQARRTSPVMVPTGTRLKRTDSSTTTCSVHSNNSNHSSNSGGSWQVVTGTGSLRGSDTASTCGDIPFAHSSFCSVVDGDEPAECVVPRKCRAERLYKVRELFYAAYFQSIGGEVRMGGPEPSIGTMISNVVEKVFPKDSK